MNKCKFCGRPAPNNMRGYCQACYKYFVAQGRKVYPLPPNKELTYAENGDAICPICGKAFRKLGGHLYNAHKISCDEAFRMFGWHRRKAKATNKDYRKHMKTIQKDYCVIDNLVCKGKSTRFGQNKGNKRELFHHSARDRCKKCEYKNGEICSLCNKSCVEILTCERRKLSGNIV